MCDLTFLQKLSETIAGRKEHPAKESYTSELFTRGRETIAKKIGEEATEVVIDAVADKRDKVIYESGDLLYHLMVLWADMGVDLKEVVDELERRHGVSGLQEKAERV